MQAEIYSYLAGVARYRGSDRRQTFTRYPSAASLAVAVCAVMTGASSVTAISDWLHDLDDIARARLGFVRGVPATTTMGWLLIRLDADLLAAILAGWLRTRVRPPATPRRGSSPSTARLCGAPC